MSETGGSGVGTPTPVSAYLDPRRLRAFRSPRGELVVTYDGGEAGRASRSDRDPP